MKHLLFILCLFIFGSAKAETLPHKPAFPIPTDVTEMVAWTNLCEKWIEAESISSGERHDDMQNFINTTPAISWARTNCGYEELESRVITLQEKYKSDPIILYTLDNLIGIYKD